jgi:hypothetical protein
MAFSTIIWSIFKNWWWFFLPIILYFPAKFLHLWWGREEWYKKQGKWILLEIKPPKEILKPFRAMEDILSVVWTVIDTPNWREFWCEGMWPISPYWFSFEILGKEGEVHFFVRIREAWRNLFESTFYSHYPEMEITLADDYTKDVPHDIPNEKWDLYGEDFYFLKDDPYPIKTYSAFFEERPEVMKEEKRIDPMNSLLESLSKIQSGEQVWFQIVCGPIIESHIPLIKMGREIADKIARRPKKPVLKPMLQEAAELLITGKPPEEKKVAEAEIIPPEMKLTPGEKRILTAIENKISKYSFKVWIRTIYLYKKDEPHFYGNYKIARAYMAHFSDADLNAFKYWGPTRTRIHYWFRRQRLYLRKRKIFKSYIERFPSLYPRWSGKPLFPFGPAKGKDYVILNTEELATIFHFPAAAAPLPPEVPRVEAKKGGPPPELPVE